MDIEQPLDQESYMWKITPGDWMCPVCRRLKPDLARENTSGEMMGNLVEHHDHIALFVKERARVLIKEAGADLSVVQGIFLKQKILPFVQRFDRVLICEDCNNADPAAKAIVGLEKYFSFSPAEIASFIIPSPNQKHALDKEKVLAATERAMPQYEYLKELSEALISRALKGRVWGEEPVGPSRDHHKFMNRHNLYPDGTWSNEELLDVWAATPDRTINKFRKRLQKKRLNSSGDG